MLCPRGTGRKRPTGESWTVSLGDRVGLPLHRNTERSLPRTSSSGSLPRFEPNVRMSDMTQQPYNPHSLCSGAPGKEERTGLQRSK